MRLAQSFVKLKVRPGTIACAWLGQAGYLMKTSDGLTVMIHVVNSFHLAKGLQTSLDKELQAALKAVQKGDIATACSALSDFIGQVQAQSGKGLTTAQATQLLNEAAVIKTRLGC